MLRNLKIGQHLGIVFFMFSLLLSSVACLKNEESNSIPPSLSTDLSKHPDAVRHILAAEIRAFHWMRYSVENLIEASRWNLGECCKLSEEVSELSDIEISKLASDDILGHALTPVIPPSFISRTGRLHKEFEFLQGLGMLPPSITWEKVRDSFDLQILEDVIDDPSEYRFDEFDYDRDGEYSE